MSRAGDAADAREDGGEGGGARARAGARASVRGRTRVRSSRPRPRRAISCVFRPECRPSFHARWHDHPELRKAPRFHMPLESLKHEIP